MAVSARPDAICILPHLDGVGGPASFRARLVTGLQARGVAIAPTVDDPACRAVLLIGGTRHILPLLGLRRRGIRVVQRLNGMNWIHRRRFTGVKHFIRSEANNLLLASIRRNLADRIVYQSNFSRTWWHTVYQAVQIPNTVIYNGVDLQVFQPVGVEQPPTDRYRVLMVEGHLGGGNEDGLRNGLALAANLQQRVDRPVELMVVGDAPERVRKQGARSKAGQITWVGVVPRDQIPAMDRAAHILFSADLNAACPNSVIEALACGLPVVSYATGSLPELVEGDAGLAVPWGSNYWKLEPPDIDALTDAAQQILQEQVRFRQGARRRAETAFGLETMVDRYLDALLG